MPQQLPEVAKPKQLLAIKEIDELLSCPEEEKKSKKPQLLKE
jgi:hypothetical protein